MAGFSQQIGESLQSLSWSLWTELGVRGVSRHHSHCAIDPEPLILFTSRLQASDPRMRDESIDWCIRNLRFISAARLRNLLKLADPVTRDTYSKYSSIVNSNSSARWPLGEDIPSGKTQLSNKSASPDLERPALIHLKLRSLFGVGARAQIIASFLARPDMQMSSLDLARLTSYTKRNVSDILEGLKMASLVKATNIGNQVRYRLSRFRELDNLIGVLPSAFPEWTSIFQLLTTIMRAAAESRNRKQEVSGVEAHQAMNRALPILEQLDITAPTQRSSAVRYWKSFVEWSSQLTGDLASGKSHVFGSRMSRVPSKRKTKNK